MNQGHRVYNQHCIESESLRLELLNHAQATGRLPEQLSHAKQGRRPLQTPMMVYTPSENLHEFELYCTDGFVSFRGSGTSPMEPGK
ncbi:MAG: hypothetical protein ACI9VR_003767 [Cognaticolwellia sp.]